MPTFPRVTAESNNLVRTLQTYGVPGTGSRAFYCPYSEVCELVEQVHSPLTEWLSRFSRVFVSRVALRMR